MRDTFSKLHHDFSLPSSENDEEEEDDFDADGYGLPKKNENGEEEGTTKQKSSKPLNHDEMKRRRSLGLKMLMSRESSIGTNGYRTEDSKVNNLIQSDDSAMNLQLNKVNQHRRKFEDESGEEC